MCIFSPTHEISINHFLINNFTFFSESMSTKTTFAPAALKTSENLEPTLPAEPVNTITFLESENFS